MSHRPTFLVLDDEEDTRFLACHALRQTFPGAEIIECDSAATALAAAGTAQLDGVVTDHHLGGSDGATFIRDLRERGATCPIVMVTASSDPEVHRRAYAAGAARVFADGHYDFAGYFRKVLNQERKPS